MSFVRVMLGRGEKSISKSAGSISIIFSCVKSKFKGSLGGNISVSISMELM